MEHTVTTHRVFSRDVVLGGGGGGGGGGGIAFVGRENVKNIQKRNEIRYCLGGKFKTLGGGGGGGGKFPPPPPPPKGPEKKTLTTQCTMVMLILYLCILVAVCVLLLRNPSTGIHWSFHRNRGCVVRC